MMQAVGAKSQESFDLLENVDSAGALVFSRNDEMPTIASVPPAEATDDEIATRIAAVKRTLIHGSSGTKVPDFPWQELKANSPCPV